MKRIISVILSVALAAAVLAGCGKNNTKTKSYNYDMSKYVQLGEYKGIEIDKNSDTFKNYVDSYFKNDVAQNSLYNQRKEGTVADGDIVNISYKGTKKSDGKVFTGTKSESSDGYESYDLTIGSGQFIDGFEEQLIGAAVGSERNIEVTFPENYGTEELNGQPAIFNVKINYINDIPAMDDEFAKKLKFENKDAYVKDLEDRTVQSIILDTIFSSEDFAVKSYPEAEKSNYDKLYDSFVSSAKQQADSYNSTNGTSLTADDVLYQIYGVTSDSLKQYYQNVLKQEIIMYAIFDAEKLSYTQQQYDETVKELAENQGVTVDELKSGMEEWAIESSVVSDIVIDFLKNSAKII